MLLYKAPYNPELKNEDNIRRDAAKREMIEGPRRHIFISSTNNTRIAILEWVAESDLSPHYRVWADGMTMGHITPGDALAAAENYVDGHLSPEQFRAGFYEMKNPNRKTRRDMQFGRKPNQPR